MSKLVKAAQRLRAKIKNTAEFNDVSECELVAEILKQTLDPNGEHQCDGCHVTWLELYDRLKEVMQPCGQ